MLYKQDGSYKINAYEIWTTNRWPVIIHFVKMLDSLELCEEA